MRARVAFVFVIVLAVGVVWRVAPVSGQEIVSPDEVSRALVVRNLQVSGDSVSGVLINKSQLPLAEVRLLIRHTFLWKQERSPQTGANPSRAIYFDVPGTVPASGAVAFTYRPDPPLPERSDGRFETSVEVVGFVFATTQGEENQESQAPEEEQKLDKSETSDE